MISTDIFKKAMSQFPSGVTIITVKKGNDFKGMTASAFISVSLNPPLILESVSKTAKIHQLLINEGHFAVSILNENQVDVSNYFAGYGKDGFEPEMQAVEGSHFVKNSLARLSCKVVQTIDAGDHTLFIGEVLNAEVEDFSKEQQQPNPLLYFNKAYRSLKSKD
jgi:flavin reductase (DIM6/NTAB) family NADH-FMN oxidoreductase RutF